MRQCSRCSVFKEDGLFYNKEHCPLWCISCKLQYKKAYRRAHPEKESRLTRYTKDPAKHMVWDARLRAKKKGLPFNLDEYIPQLRTRIGAGFCEITGLPFGVKGRGRKLGADPFSASLDRISPAKGYVYDNIRIVCWAVNLAMSNWGEDLASEIFSHWPAVRRRVLSCP